MNRPEPLPIDVRLMNALASGLFLAAALLLLGALLNRGARLPQFAIKGVSVTGDVVHYNAITLRANVMPRLQGTFFTLDVNAARKVFELSLIHILPFPFAVDDHQTINARFLVDGHAAWLVPQAQLTPQYLAEALLKLERPALMNKGLEAKKMQKLDATEQVVLACEDLAP